MSAKWRKGVNDRHQKLTLGEDAPYGVMLEIFATSKTAGFLIEFAGSEEVCTPGVPDERTPLQMKKIALVNLIERLDALKGEATEVLDRISGK